MPLYYYSYMLAMFPFTSFQFVTCEEPQCSRYYMEEKLLERMISIDIKLQHTGEKLKDIEDKQQCKKKTIERLEPTLANTLKIDDLEIDDWEMVFRATSGNGHNVYEAWTTGKGACDAKPVTMERSYACHYRNNAIVSWSNIGIKYVKYAFFDRDRELANVIFNGEGSSITSWFDKSRVISASWSDLTPMHKYNYFSVKGHLERKFFINRDYSGCSGDHGHICVIDTDTPQGGCRWEEHPVYPQFLYSQINSVDYWDRRAGRADYMAIFIKST